MGEARARGWLARALAAGLLIAAATGSAPAQVGDDLGALNQRFEELYDQGKYSEATEIARKSLALSESKFGPDHAEVGTSLNNLALLYKSQGRYSEAEPLYAHALAIRETALGPDHPDVGTSLNNLAVLYEAQRRYGAAEPLYRRALGVYERALGPDHPDLGTSLNNLAVLYKSQGRYGEAEPLYSRALAIREKALGPGHPDVGTSLNNLALLYEVQGRYGAAEPLMKRALGVYEKALGPNHPNVGISLNNLAVLYQAQGRYGAAEPLYVRALAIREKALGPGHPDVGTSLNNLAALYKGEGRYGAAEPLYTRALAISEKALGPDHPDVGTSLSNLAALYKDQGRYGAAEPLMKRALGIYETALGRDHPDVGASLSNLAALYEAQGHYGAAEPLIKRALAIRETALGPGHPDVGTSLNNLAALYQVQGRFSEAEPLYQRSLALRETALGRDHPDVSTSLSNLAALALAQGDWAQAADYWRRSTAVIARRTQRGTAVVAAASGNGMSEAEQESYRFRGLVKVVHRLASAQPSSKPSLSAETFATAQWALGSEAATSLAQMAVRGAKGDPSLSRVVWERQDLVVEWQKRDGVRTATVAQAPEQRDAKAEAANVARLSAIDARIAEIDRRLKAEFPDYAALASPQPLTVEEVQVDLRADEALVLFLSTPEWKPTPEETFVWVVTKTDILWVRSDLGTPALTREVAALRCGLDGTAWLGEGERECADLLRIPIDQAPRYNAPLPFDHARSHALYKALFGEVADLIKGKHLLIVPSGPLTQLPFQVLVTAPPPHASSLIDVDHRKIGWLARDHAITVLPAVSSLKALRRIGKPSLAAKPIIGFGNPLLDGPRGPHSARAEDARKKQQCPDTPWQRVASLLGRSGGVATIETRSGIADTAHLKAQNPLPETADELCAVARDLGGDKREMRLGARATETEIKRLSAAQGNDRLANYRIVHFATHGMLAGQITGSAEPGLVLTPPDTPTEADDGYLSASEITGLKLDADWVILSACNTAAGGADGAEALSGLARAFFFAQARALLVSHWEVNSDTTVKLITSAVRAMTRNRKVGRAEALRRAMLAMIDKGEAREAHPAYWAPFVVVGEGAAQM